jgi:TRAP-type C4-dicarboxylate transport system substrate-binding protein
MKAFVLGALAIAGTALAPAPLQAQQTIDLAIFHPERNSWTPTLQWWIEETGKATQNRVVFKPHFASALVNVTETFKAVRDGAVPAGVVAAGVVSGQMPAMAYLEAIGGMPDDPDKFLAVQTDLRPVLTDMLGRQGVAYLWGQGSGPLIVLTRDKHLLSAADWKGKKIRTAGRWQAEQIRALGAAAVAMDPAEQYLGLQNRTIDGALSINLLAQSLKLHEVAPKITELRLPVNLSFYIMNKGQFEKLSAADRETTLRLGVQGEKRSAPLLQTMSDEGAAAMKAQKADSVRLNDAQLADFRKGIDAAFAKMDAETGEDGKKIAAIVKKYW